MLLVLESDPKSGLDLSSDTDLRRWNVRRMKSLEVRDIVSQKVLWSKSFHSPIDSFDARAQSDSIVFVSVQKDVINLAFHQLSTGNQLGQVAIHTNKHSFHVTGASVAGEYFLVADSEQRVTVYDKAGHETAQVFGSYAVADPKLGVFAASAEDRRITFYDLSTGRKRETLNLPESQAFYRFDKTGQKLFVLTTDQTAYAFDVGRLLAPAPSAGN